MAVPTFIPPDVRTILKHLGIVAPDANRWERGLVPSRHTRDRAYFCKCDGQRHGTLTETHLAGRHIMIAQCVKCGLIYWEDIIRK